MGVVTILQYNTCIVHLRLVLFIESVYVGEETGSLEWGNSNHVAFL